VKPYKRSGTHDQSLTPSFLPTFYSWTLSPADLYNGTRHPRLSVFCREHSQRVHMEQPLGNGGSDRNEQPRGYKSRFHEHLSQAYTAPSDLPTPPSPKPRTERRAHRHSPSFDSFRSASSTSSTLSSSSKSWLRKLGFGKSSDPAFVSISPPTRSSPEPGYKLKGSAKTIRKEDIKVAGLTSSTVYFHSL
jgi:hypothetical protein